MGVSGTRMPYKSPKDLVKMQTLIRWGRGSWGLPDTGVKLGKCMEPPRLSPPNDFCK